VVVINYGPEAGKLATVVNMIDTKRVLIDGPQKHTGVHRQILNLKRMALTDIVVEGLERDADAKTLTAAFEAQDIMGKWTATTWAKKIKARKVIFPHTRHSGTRHSGIRTKAGAARCSGDYGHQHRGGVVEGGDSDINARTHRPAAQPLIASMLRLQSTPCWLLLIPMLLMPFLLRPMLLLMPPPRPLTSYYITR
jgi:ribosomal protein L14E/L6E/L27E